MHEPQVKCAQTSLSAHEPRMNLFCTLLALLGRPHRDVPLPPPPVLPQPPPPQEDAEWDDVALQDIANFDTQVWNVTINKKVASIVCLLDGHSIDVPSNRVNKAMAALNMKAVAQLMQPHSCRCDRGCYAKFTPLDILKVRRAYVTCGTEGDASTFLVNKLQPLNDPAPALGTPLSYAILGKATCATFFSKAYAVSNNKMKIVRSMIYNETSHVSHGNKNKHRRTSRSAYTIAVSFWSTFFDKFCQRPNDKVRLFPVNQSYKSIHTDFYRPWHQKVHGGDVPLVSPNVFYEARYDDLFKDVQNRPKHHHCRCKDCALLAARRRRGFCSELEREKFDVEARLHYEDAKNWHVVEATDIARSKHNPHEVITLQYDDTSAFGLPNLTKRPHKGLTKTRVEVIPNHFQNYATRTSAYVYTLKHAFKKGANRLMTTLFIAMTMVKNSHGPASGAREVICLADNYSENKNSAMLCFGSEMVLRGWVDSWEFKFGPPGHTHNGSDAVHNYHNEHAGNYVALTLGEHQLNFAHVWTQEKKPQCVLLHHQYDWVKRYKPYHDKLAGFTKTKFDPDTVQAFRCQRNPATNVVEVVWKMRAADQVWLGMDGLPNSPGFIVLKNLPMDIPALIEPNLEIIEPKYVQGLTTGEMVKVFESEGRPEAMSWIQEVIKKGCVPVTRLEGDNWDLANWGVLCNVGVSPKLGTFFLVESRQAQTIEEFWRLPDSVIAHRTAVDSVVAEVQRARAHLPNVRYQRVSPASRLVYTSQSQSTLTVEPPNHEDSELRAESHINEELHCAPAPLTLNDELQGRRNPPSEVLYFGPEDSFGYRPRKESFQINDFYLVKLGIRNTPVWSVCQLKEEPVLRSGSGKVSRSKHVWEVKVMYWDKTKNSRANFVRDPRSKQVSADGTDWCYCESIDIALKLTGTRVKTMSASSVDDLNSRIDEWYKEESKRPPPSAYLGKPCGRKRNHDNSSSGSEGEDGSECDD